LIDDAVGTAIPLGNSFNTPGALPCVTVTFTETALAVAGIPHRPPKANDLCVFAPRAGPPYGPEGLRVSSTRHGVSV
jgi:hypothetical protein